MREQTFYVAEDGTPFERAEDCVTYESVIAHKAAIGLTAAQIKRAVEGEDLELGDALEKLGAACAKRRLEMGLSKRPRRDADAPAEEPKQLPAPKLEFEE